MNKPKIAFICTHNSCRSQIAEALGKAFASDVFEAYSAGTEIKPQINKNAVKAIKELYGIDMEKQQFPKTLDKLPDMDIVITMGCGVKCPFLKCRYREDWGLADPTGKPFEEFVNTSVIIEKKIKDLRDRIIKNEIKLI